MPSLVLAACATSKPVRLKKRDVRAILVKSCLYCPLRATVPDGMYNCTRWMNGKFDINRSIHPDCKLPKWEGK